MLVDLHAPATPSEAHLKKVVKAIPAGNQGAYAALATFSLLWPLELLDGE